MSLTVCLAAIDCMLLMPEVASVMRLYCTHVFALPACISSSLPYLSVDTIIVVMKCLQGIFCCAAKICNFVFSQNLDQT